jgi:hypothetical protein
MANYSPSYLGRKSHLFWTISTFIFGLSGSTVLFTLSHKQHNFQEKYLLNIKHVFWFSLQILSEKFVL